MFKVIHMHLQNFRHISVCKQKKYFIIFSYNKRALRVLKTISVKLGCQTYLATIGSEGATEGLMKLREGSPGGVREIYFSAFICGENVWI